MSQNLSCFVRILVLFANVCKKLFPVMKIFVGVCIHIVGFICWLVVTLRVRTFQAGSLR